MIIKLPETCVVAMVGASGSGKSTFAKKYFKSTEVLSSDYFRGLVSDDENNQEATNAAFDSLYYIANKRLEAGKLTVIDATNVKPSSRKEVIKLAEKNNYFSVAIVLNMTEKVCIERNKSREDRNFGTHVVRKHCLELKKSIRRLKNEGFKYVFILNSPEEVSDVEIIRTKLWNNKIEEQGPFDIIGDIHGCYDELSELLDKLDYKVDNVNKNAIPPLGRKAIFLGDLVDRGPKIVETLELVMNMVESGHAFCVSGNHDAKLLSKLKGKDVKVRHGLEYTLEQMKKKSKDFEEKVEVFLESLISHYVLDNRKLVVAHAGMKEEYQGKSSGKVKEFALFGEKTGELDERGLPIRYNWALDYKGKAKVVYGHTPQEEAYEINNTINIDTGCVFGEKLTAYSYPEGRILSVKAHKAYYKFFKPLQKVYEDRESLHIEDVLGKRHIFTNLYPSITIEEGNSSAALESISRFAADPRWLIYLPPTMSPCETSKIDGILEHPIEAFSYYKSNGIEKVVCEEKHMGSRAMIIICKDTKVCRKRFTIDEENAGIIYTRTGRHFFDDRKIEKELLDIIRKELDESNFWDDFSTDWVCIDTELMPWSSKARTLLSNQYAPVGCSGRVGLESSIEVLEATVKRNSEEKEVDKVTSGQNTDLNEILNTFKEKKKSIDGYIKSYREYCWSVDSLDDYRIAPFHILATEGEVHSNKNNVWHMETIKKYFVKSNPIMVATSYKIIDFKEEKSIEDAISWWEDLTKTGGEGMVVKPYNFISKNDSKVIQPAVKCRGKEYLRIIYGPEYTFENNLRRLKRRSLTKKRKLALKEFSLGIESLKRFVKNEPLYRVHECTFGVLAMESEPVDPRL